MIRSRKRENINKIWLVISVVLVGFIVAWAIFGTEGDKPPKTPPVADGVLTQVQAATVMQDAQTKYFTHNKIKEVQTTSSEGVTVKTTNIYTSDMAYMLEEYTYGGVTESTSAWVCKDQGKWFVFYIEDGSTVEYIKMQVSVQNDDARYFMGIGEQGDSNKTFVGAFSEEGETTIIYDLFDNDLNENVRGTYTIKDGEMIKMVGGLYNEQTQGYDATILVEYSYDLSVEDTIPALPNHPWKEELTATQAGQLIAQAYENYYTHDIIKEVVNSAFLFEIKTTNIYTAEMVYTKDEITGFGTSESWVCKNGNEWFLYHIEDEDYIKESVIIPEDDARYYASEDGQDSELDGMELTFVEGQMVDNMATLVYSGIDEEEGGEAKFTYIIRSGDLYQMKVEVYDTESGQYFEILRIGYAYDDAVTDTVPGLPTPPEGYEWELYEGYSI